MRNEYNDISNFGPGEGTGLSGLGALSGTNDQIGGMKLVKIGGINLEDVENSNYQVMGTNT